MLLCRTSSRKTDISPPHTIHFGEFSLLLWIYWFRYIFSKNRFCGMVWKHKQKIWLTAFYEKICYGLHPFLPKQHLTVIFSKISCKLGTTCTVFEFGYFKVNVSVQKEILSACITLVAMFAVLNFKLFSLEKCVKGKTYLENNQGTYKILKCGDDLISRYHFLEYLPQGKYF